MHCNLCLVLPLVASLVAPDWTPWMDPGCGPCLALPGTVNGPCCPHPACHVHTLGDTSLGGERTPCAGVTPGSCLAFPLASQPLLLPDVGSIGDILLCSWLHGEFASEMLFWWEMHVLQNQTFG